MWWGLALAAELALVDLPVGWTLRVDGQPATHRTEARDLSAGVHTVQVIDTDGRVQFKHTALLYAHERVLLDVRQVVHAEVERGPIPERTEIPPEATAANVDVVVMERAVRLWVDGRAMRYDETLRRFAEELLPGAHRLEATRDGRVRSVQTLAVAGRPWRCTATAAGELRCVEEVPLDGLPRADLEALMKQVRDLPPHLRVRELADVSGRLTCSGLARLVELLSDDAERLAVLRALRSKVEDPWNHAVLQEELSFPDSRREVVSLYER